MKQELQKIALFGSAVLLIIFFRLAHTQDHFSALQWLLQAGLIWGFVCQFTWRKLSLNRANENAPLYQNLGWGNRLTILRGGLIAVTGGCLFLLQEIWLIALPYTLAAILDRLDGFVARRCKQTSLLGTELDITFDALGLVVAPLIAITSGQIHWSYLLLSVAYYVYQAGLRYREKNTLPIYESPPNTLRRTLAGFQMGFIALVIWSIFTPTFTNIASVAFMLPVLFGFCVDWLIISGKLEPQVIIDLGKLSEIIFQPALRVLLVWAIFLFINSNTMSNFLQLGFIMSGIAILLGFAGRLGALFILIFLGNIDINVNILSCILIFSTSWMLLLGTGNFSVWQFGDEWVKRYDGA